MGILRIGRALRRSDQARFFVKLGAATVGILGASACGKPGGEKFQSLVAQPGQRVGHVNREEVILDPPAGASGQASEFAAAAAASASVSASASSRSVAVVAVNFSNEASGCSVSDLNTLMFTDPMSVKKFYEETSYGQFTVTGQVLGSVTINSSAAGCDANGWISAADSAAAVAGMNLSTYQGVIYVMPRSTAQTCGFYGASTSPGSPSARTIIRGDICLNGADVYMHEFGHQAGMYHASTPGNEYGDLSDIMGAGVAQVNAPHRLQMGWLPTDRAPMLASSGSYRIYNLESLGPETRVLRIPKPDTHETYYVSYRIPTGFDMYLPSAAMNAVSIHRWSGSGNTILLQYLPPGASFTDSVNGITITHSSQDGTSALVQVTMPGGPGPSPTPSPSPSPTVTPSPSPTITPSPSPTLPAYAREVWGVSTDVPLIGKFSGQSRAEIAAYRPSEHNWYIRHSNGSYDTVNWGADGDIPLAGDLLGNGRSQMIQFRPSTGTWYGLDLLGGGMYVTQWGTAGDKPLIGNFLGSGKNDIAVFRPSSGDIWIRDAQDGSRYRQLHWGIATDKPSVGAFFGNGRDQIAQFRESTGTWWIIDAVSGEMRSYQWGTVGDIPVPGHYFTSSRSALAVFRPSTGTVYVMDPIDGRMSIFNWGAQGDVPLAGDLLGSGRDQVTQFRSSTGEWWTINF